jgi:hypothetical protein
MKKMLTAVAALSCAIAGGATLLHAQDAAMEQPPKLLVIGREMVKFGKVAGHEKNEAAFAKAFAAAKMPGRYLATTTISGPDEAWFFQGFDSYADWEKADKFGDQPSIEAVMTPLMEKDADYVSEGSQIIATYNDKWSYQPAMNMAEMRYFELETIRIRTGHDKDWEDLVALYNATAAKINLDEHDIFYEVHYGAPDGTIYIFTPRKSRGELDGAMATGKAFQSALGAEGQQKWSKLLQAAIEADSTELLQFSPRMSYPPDDWVKADPDFWKPKMMSMAPKPAKKSEETAPK